jgi:hypothetical protein
LPPHRAAVFSRFRVFEEGETLQASRFVCLPSGGQKHHGHCIASLTTTAIIQIQNTSHDMQAFAVFEIVLHVQKSRPKDSDLPTPRSIRLPQPSVEKRAVDASSHSQTPNSFGWSWVPAFSMPSTPCQAWIHTHSNASCLTASRRAVYGGEAAVSSCAQRKHRQHNPLLLFPWPPARDGLCNPPGLPGTRQSPSTH